MCMHAKLIQLCLTLCDPKDHSLPGSSVHGHSPGKNTGASCHALFQGFFSTQGSNPGLLHCRWILYYLNYHESLRILDWVAYPFSKGSSWPRNWTGVPALKADSLPSELSGKPHKCVYYMQNVFLTVMLKVFWMPLSRQFTLVWLLSDYTYSKRSIHIVVINFTRIYIKRLERVDLN